MSAKKKTPAPKEPEAVPLEQAPQVPESLVPTPTPTKKPSRWARIGNAIGETIGAILYRGPR